MAFALLICVSGCSVKRYAINKIGDSLSSGVSVFETDDDIGLVGDALPFSLKLLEILLAESPEHEGLLLSACKGFAMYSYVYVQYDAEKMMDTDIDAYQDGTARARRLYLRSLGYGLRALEVAHPGVVQRLQRDPSSSLEVARKKDVPLLYWTAASLGLAISVSKGNAEMIARIPEVDALLARALVLDESWSAGTLHEFNLILGGARPFVTDLEPMKKSYARALELSEGKRASLFVAYAEIVSVKNQDYEEFKMLLGRALAVDPDEQKDTRMANMVSQRRAKWLLGRAEMLFLDTGDGGDEQ